MTAPRTPKGGTRGTVYRAVARLRIEDAKSLLKSRRHNGAIYMAGYAVECHLKFAFCHQKCVTHLPGKLEVHDWDTLVSAAGMLPAIKAQRAMDALYSALVDRWGPSLRYSTATYSPNDANRLYTDMEQLYQFFTELVP